MSTWIQLKDGVAFASVESPYFVDNSILLEDGMTFEDIHPKKYENGTWVEAPLVYFVTQLIDGVVHQINSTVYSSDVTGDVVSSAVQIGWVKDENGTFNTPITEQETV
jgi:hypothetical protein